VGLCACHENWHLNVQQWCERGVFLPSDFEICFTPQGCAPFRHLNIQKWSGTNSFYLFQLRNVLRATTARYFPTSQHPKVLREWGVFNMLTSMCNVWTSQRPKVLRHWGAFSFLTSKSASRHNCVQFFIAHPAACNKTLEKQCLATYLPFAHLDLLSTDSFSSFPFSSNSYCSHPCCCVIQKSEIWLLNFLRLCVLISRMTQFLVCFGTHVLSLSASLFEGAIASDELKSKYAAQDGPATCRVYDLVRCLEDNHGWHSWRSIIVTHNIAKIQEEQ